MIRRKLLTFSFPDELYSFSFTKSRKEGISKRTGKLGALWPIFVNKVLLEHDPAPFCSIFMATLAPR